MISASAFVPVGAVLLKCASRCGRWLLFSFAKSVSFRLPYRQNLVRKAYLFLWASLYRRVGLRNDASRSERFLVKHSPLLGCYSNLVPKRKNEKKREEKGKEKESLWRSRRVCSAATCRIYEVGFELKFFFIKCSAPAFSWKNNKAKRTVYQPCKQYFAAALCLQKPLLFRGDWIACECSEPFSQQSPTAQKTQGAESAKHVVAPQPMRSR